MHKRLPIENLLQEPTNDLTQRAIQLANDLMEQNSSLTEDQAIDEVIETFKRERVPNSPWQKRRQQKAASEQIPEKDSAQTISSQTRDYEQAMKTISNKNVDVSKFLKDE